MRQLKHLVCSAFLMPGLVLPALAKDGAPAAPSESELSAYVTSQMEAAGIAGVGAAILVDRKVVWMKGYGKADLASGSPFTPDTVMNIGSISKTVTGVAMMRAVQDGLVSLDADVNTYLPFKLVNPHRPEAVITLRHLALHTSGITDRSAVYAASYHYGGDTPPPLGEFLAGYLLPGGKDYSPDNFLDQAPGSYREYSNIGAGLAGYIIEQRTGQSLGDYAREVIFEPLGMANTSWSLADVDRERHATLYVRHNDMTVPIPFYELATYPDGGVRTSVADLSRLFVALLDEGAMGDVRVLEPEHVREMLRFQYVEGAPANEDPARKNSGLFWQSKYDVTRMGHGGSDPGVNTDMLANLEGDIGVIMFSNTSLAGREGVHPVNIFQALWNYAETLKAK